ncbi:MFS transporter [Saccharopolyspora rosea]|uniref:MFS transporter n=1 Tax=Saccharopolyspora rosea TaxID=524884 RepID=A0ABW3G0J5_9PSEU|nr:MFS transporter [Saccharopolyspora rosea]
MTTPAPDHARRARLASMIGTTIEWYDYFLYGTASALIFGPQFFPDLSPTAGKLAAFSTLAIGFIARPLGGVLMGHFGDRLGRKSMLVFSLLVMGGSTVAIGLLPTYRTWGVAAPLALVACRLVQGLSAGGEWGGAALMAVEHAPAGRRGLFGSYAQVGTPLGMILSSLVFLAVRSSVTAEQFTRWGWRIPFALSLLLVLLGLYIRLRVVESPVFAEVRAQQRQARMPLTRLLRHQPRQVLIATFTFVGNNTLGYIFMVYLVSYTTEQLGLSQRTALLNLAAGSVVWLVTNMFFGHLSDRIGRRATYLWGTALNLVWAFPMFWLINTGTAVLVLLAQAVHLLGVSATYGPQAALFSELFRPEWRYSGASLAYSLGAVLGGGFAPMVCTALFDHFGTTTAISGYMVVVSLISLVAIAAIPRHLGRSASAPRNAAPTTGREQP